MLKIEIPADRSDLITAIGFALISAGTRRTLTLGPAETAGNENGEVTVSTLLREGLHPEGGGEQIADLDMTDGDKIPFLHQLDDGTEVYANTALTPAQHAALPEDINAQHYGPVVPVEDNTGTSDSRVDPNGVPFNEEYCGNAAKPFYASGPTKDQWKKKKGVTDDAYNGWYAGQLSIVNANKTETTGGNNDSVNTAGAFGGGGDQNTATDDIPTDCGAFMGWVASKQVAGFFTQDNVNAAYSQLGLVVTDLFPPTPPDAVARHIANLYEILNQ